jgi:hypothetical protein
MEACLVIKLFILPTRRCQHPEHGDQKPYKIIRVIYATANTEICIRKIPGSNHGRSPDILTSVGPFYTFLKMCQNLFNCFSDAQKYSCYDLKVLTMSKWEDFRSSGLWQCVAGRKVPGISRETESWAQGHVCKFSNLRLTTSNTHMAVVRTSEVAAKLARSNINAKWFLRQLTYKNYATIGKICKMAGWLPFEFYNLSIFWIHVHTWRIIAANHCNSARRRSTNIPNTLRSLLKKNLEARSASSGLYYFTYWHSNNK